MAAVPSSAPRPQDRKAPPNRGCAPTRKRASAAGRAEAASAARRAEAADDEYVIIERCGVTIRIPRDQGQWPIGVLRRFTGGNEVGAMLMLIGDAQVDALESAGAVADDLTAIADEFAAAIGVDDTGN